MISDWRTSSLGQLAKVSSGSSAPQKRRLFANGTHPFFRTSDVGRIHFGEIREAADYLNDDGVRGLRRFPSGTILFPKSGASTFLNHRALLGVPGFVSSHLAAIETDETRLNPKFLLYFLTTVAAQDLIQDHAYPSLNLHSIAAIEVHYPPILEQERIVAILDEAFGAIAAARANIQRALRSSRDLGESYLGSVLADRGGEWDRLPLKILLERKWIEGHQDGNHGSNYPRKSEFVAQGIPYISANCISNDRVELSRAKHLSPERAALIRTGIARDNDVLFAHNATVGPVAILRTDSDNVILGTSLTYYRCNPKYVLPQYLAHYMRSSGFVAQYLQVMAQSTRNQVPITMQREFLHVIPPLREQTDLLHALDGIFDNGLRLQESYRRRLGAFDELKRALLHSALTGAI